MTLPPWMVSEQTKAQVDAMLQQMKDHPWMPALRIRPHPPAPEGQIYVPKPGKELLYTRILRVRWYRAPWAIHSPIEARIWLFNRLEIALVPITKAQWITRKK